MGHLQLQLLPPGGVQLLSSAAGLWMDVYHCDGIRMDAISRALYWQGDPNRGVNQGAVNFCAV